MSTFTIPGDAIPILTAIVGALTTAIVFLFRALIAAKDREILEAQRQRDTYQQMSYQAITVLEHAANDARASKGLPPFTALAPIIPLHNSPTTPKQIVEAELQTLLARQTAAALILNIPLVPLDGDESKEHGVEELKDRLEATKDKDAPNP